METTRETVFRLRADGLKLVEIAREIGMSRGCVSSHLRSPEPRVRMRPRVDRGTTSRTLQCARCGGPTGGESSTLCRSCHTAPQRQARQRDYLLLQMWAMTHGVVPSVQQAMEITGRGRSTAAQFVLEVFGRDDRDGAQRRQSPRPYPTRPVQ